MNELNLKSWLVFVCNFLGHILFEAFALAGEEESLERFLDNLSRAVSLNQEND